MLLFPFTGTLIGILSRERESRNSRVHPGLSSLSLSWSQNAKRRTPYTSTLYALLNLRITVRTQTLLERVERISGLPREPL